MDPITREEKLMAGEQLEPITRKEYFLAKAAGMDVETPEPITREEMFLSMISGGGTGGSGGGGSIPSVSPKAVNFYDYDGTCLYAYTVEEAQALTKMPPLPEREGLICQGWNWTLEDVKACNMAVDVGATYITDDGTTRIYITLHEGRTSPMLGVCPNGTVTVDWGDGTAPDTLTGTSTSTGQWTPTHEYAKPGDYVIRLTVDGEMGFRGNNAADEGSCILRYSSSADTRNTVYRNSVKKVEIGVGIASIGSYAFQKCYSLAYITIPNSVTSVDNDAFYYCYALKSIVIPNSVTSVGSNAFYYCYALKSIVIPNSVTSIGYKAVYNCYNLASVVIPNSVYTIYENAFYNCYNLASVVIHNGVKRIGNITTRQTFANCSSLASVVIPNSVTYICSNAFQYCRGVRVYDFSSHTAIPNIETDNVFEGISSDCEIRVPAALYDQIIAAKYWSTYASQIVAV